MFWLKKWSVQPQKIQKVQRERESSLPPPSRQKPFYVFFSLIPIRFASFSAHSSPPHPVFILAHLLCSNPFFLSLTRCRGSTNWSRLCHDTGTWHNCWTNSVPFSIRPVSAKQHADSNWLETLITGPVPQRLIGRGFPQEWGCLCAHVCCFGEGVDSGLCLQLRPMPRRGRKYVLFHMEN